MYNVVLKELEECLSKCQRYLDENNQVLKSKVQSDALNLNDELLEILVNSKVLKDAFFKSINGTLIFDKVSFSWTVNSSEFLPNSFTMFKNKIGLVDQKNELISHTEDVVLSFPYKDCVLEFDSTDENEQRDEVYLNETLCKNDIDCIFENKILSNAKLISQGQESEIVNYNGENLVIKGNNLISMHSLLPRFAGQIKLMYWDILYNTNNDKVPYNDKFKHSSWLTMMKNRLDVAYKLLKIDGIICIQCDDNEMAYLKVLCDEVFGRVSFVNCLAVEMSPSSGVKRAHKEKGFIKNKEYILIYSKGKIAISPQYDEWSSFDNHYSIYFDGKQYTSLLNILKKKFSKYSELNSKMYLFYNDVYSFIVKESGKIYRTHDASAWALSNVNKGKVVCKSPKIVKVENPNNIEEFELLKEKNNGGFDRLEPLSWNVVDDKLCTLRGDLWLDFDKDMGNVSKEGSVKLSAGKKPERLLKDIICSFSNAGDIILDAYFGTGTTGAVAMKLNRRFIGLEQLDEHYDKSIHRLKTVINGDSSGISADVNWQGGGEFVTCELLKQNQQWIDVINNSTEESIDGLYDEILSNPFVVNYKINLDLLKTAEIKEDFSKLSFDDKKKILIALMDKNNLYVNYCERQDKEIKVSENDIAFSESFYGEK